MNKLVKFWKRLGPGVVTGVSDDDPSGIATYSQAGARFGLGLLWCAFLTYPLMYAIQEMCARIGIVNSRGLAGTIHKNYPKALGYILNLFVIPAILLNIAADISGMGAVLHLLYPSLPIIFYNIFMTVALATMVVYFKYTTIATFLKYVCLVLICYFIIPFLVVSDWKQVLAATFIPSMRWDGPYLSMLVAVLGTTISPYLFYWQSSMSLEQKNHNSQKEKKEIKDMKSDVHAGMFASNLAMYFIILSTGSVLFPQGITDIETIEQAALALEPLAGEFAFILFSLGIIGVGILSLPVLAACIGYIVSETAGWKKGLDKTPKTAPGFYGAILSSFIIGFVIASSGIDPVKSLILTAQIYGVLAPFLIAVILHIVNNSKIMGKYTNSRFQNFLGIIAFLLMGISSILLFIVSPEGPSHPG